MTGEEIAALTAAAMGRLAGAREELRDLDAALGDGDLGITVSEGAAAVSHAVAGLAAPGPAEVLRAAARAFAAANPSTFAALTAAGLLAAAREVTGQADVDHAGAARMLTAAVTAIQQRGGAVPGDKTVVDAILPSLAALQQPGPDGAATLEAMAKAAGSAVTETSGLQSRRGRAAWVGERSVGHPDGGATAYLRFLEALSSAWPGTGRE